MAKVVISLLGGRPLPNILGVLHLKPDHLHIVVSKDSLGKGGNYERAISALPTPLRPTAPDPVDPYLPGDTIHKCETIADLHKDDQIVIVSASEPKTMGFGAYEFATRCRSSGREVDMCYISREGLVWVFRGENTIERLKISLKADSLTDLR